LKQTVLRAILWRRRYNSFACIVYYNCLLSSSVPVCISLQNPITKNQPNVILSYPLSTYQKMRLKLRY